jgi:Cu-Zn family superoxide dismutase
MRRVLAAAALAAACVPVLVAQQAGSGEGQAVAKAKATIAGEGITGTAEFTELTRGTGRVVQVVVKVTGLKPGLHGMHLHAVGKCEAPFASAGGHFDPGPYGHMDPDTNHPFHMGDLPNIDVKGPGEASASATTTRVTLTDGPLTVFDADGTALIIHANPDQGITGAEKSGVSGGPRVACGVLEKVQ